MKRPSLTGARVVATVLFGLVVLALVGPRTPVEEPSPVANGATADAPGVVSRPATLSALPAWLAAREQAAGVTDTGVVKRVVFAGDTVRTAWSVVYLHGFSATRQETAPLSEEVAAAMGANLFETRLAGHGLPGDSMGTVTAQDWLTDAEEALAIGAQLGDSVLVIGTSTGGTLAAWLATRPPAQRAGLRALVLISPNFGPKDQAAAVLTLPWASVVLPPFIPEREWTPRNELQRRYWTVRYPSTALFPMQALVESVRERPLTGYDLPTLILLNDADPVVDAERTRRWAESVLAGTSARLEIVAIEPIDGEDAHVLAGAITAPSQTIPVRDRILAFLR